MNILLLSTPNSFKHMPTVAIRIPNATFTSLAGNIDPHQIFARYRAIRLDEREYR